eukprot:1152040-Pelagomonas_calceolata.AAC.1
MAFRNQIEVLHGLNGLSALNTLSLTHNKLRSIEGLEALCSLRHLNLKGNRLSFGASVASYKHQSINSAKPDRMILDEVEVA